MLDAKKSENKDTATPAKQKWKERRRLSQTPSFQRAAITPCDRKPPPPVNASCKKETHLQEQSPVIDSEPSFDFRTARQLLVNRKW